MNNYIESINEFSLEYFESVNELGTIFPAKLNKVQKLRKVIYNLKTANLLLGILIFV